MPDNQPAPTPSTLPSEAKGQSQQDRIFSIGYFDWLRIRGKVDKLKQLTPYLAGVGWTCIGITLAALLALPVWLSADSELSSGARMHYTFVTPLLIIIPIAGIVISAYTFIVGYQMRQIYAIMIKDVLDDMDAVLRRSSR